jgi:hypothetical protein
MPSKDKGFFDDSTWKLRVFVFVVAFSEDIIEMALVKRREDKGEDKATIVFPANIDHSYLHVGHIFC